MCLNIFLMLRAQHIAVCAYPSVILCLEVDTLQLGCKTGKSINSILKSKELLQCCTSPDLTRYHAQHAGKIGRSSLGGDASLSIF